MKGCNRITVNPEQMGGLPCIRGLRIPVATVVGMVSEGMSEAEILRAYPDLEPEDIPAALRHAAEVVELPALEGYQVSSPAFEARARSFKNQGWSFKPDILEST